MSAKERGYSLLEVVVALSIFGFFVLMSAQLTREMTGYEARLPVEFLRHPQLSAVLSRVRRDVADATTPYYPASYQSYSQTESTLILYSLQPSGYAQTVVWDFSKEGEARRIAYSVGNVTSNWVARGVPAIHVSDFEIEGHPDSVRLIAHDKKNVLAIDQILQPRAHE